MFNAYLPLSLCYFFNFLHHFLVAQKFLQFHKNFRSGLLQKSPLTIPFYKTILPDKFIQDGFQIPHERIPRIAHKRRIHGEKSARFEESEIFHHIERRHEQTANGKADKHVRHHGNNAVEEAHKSAGIARFHQAIQKPRHQNNDNEQQNHQENPDN